MNIAYSRQMAKDLMQKAEYKRFECVRMEKIARYIEENANNLKRTDVDFLLSWLNHSNYTAEKIIAMFSEDEKKGE